MSAPAPPVHQPCPLCAATAHEPIKRFEDGVMVGRCTSCGLLYTPLRHAQPEGLLAGATPEQLRLLYAPIISGRHRHFRAKNFQQYLRIIGRHTPGRRLLDVGCAHGFFLAEARAQGYETNGVEPSLAMAEFATQELGLRVLQGRIEDVALGQESWDAISLTDSAEYLPSPVRDLSRLVEHLAPNGVLFVKVPNGDYFRLRHALERLFVGRVGGLHAFSPSRRVVHYTAATLAKTLQEVGLEILESGAMGNLDSPVWPKLTGIWLETESPWHIGLGPRVLRRALNLAGHAETAFLRTNHLSQSIFAVGRRVRQPSPGARPTGFSGEGSEVPPDQDHA